MTEPVIGAAFLMGIVSAVSLPLGALTLLRWRPNDRAQAVLMAVGGGALLAALTIDLVGSAVAQGHFYFMAAGAVLGGLLFISLNQLVNRYGGFLRKTSTTLVYLRRQRQGRLRRILSRMGRIDIYRDLPERELFKLAEAIDTRAFRAGEIMYKQQDPCDGLFVIEEGTLELLDPQKGMQPFERLGRSDAFARMAFFTGAPTQPWRWRSPTAGSGCSLERPSCGTAHSKTAVAVSDVSVWSLRKRDFDALLKGSPRLERVVRQFIQQTPVADYLRVQHDFDQHSAARWVHLAMRDMDAGRLIPSASAVFDQLSGRAGAPLAIWLGILLDGIPESLVIGASLVHTQLSLSLIAGLFLANYPEALSSSAGMRQQGFSYRTVLLMWTSIMLLTGVGAALGSLLFLGLPPFVFSFTEGVAAGAMLVMIAETMLPEAYIKGGAVVGMSTLFGFLAAIFFKTLE